MKSLNKKIYKKILTTTVALLGIYIGLEFLKSTMLKSEFHLTDLLTSIISDENIIALTNRSRETEELQSLKVSKKLEEAAQKKAEDMLKNQYFAHTSPVGKTPWNFFEEAEYNYLYAGENLAINFQTAEDVTRGWLTSQSHRENILNPQYSEIGIGIASGNFRGTQSVMVVQMFGKPLSETIARGTKIEKQLASALNNKSEKLFVSALKKSYPKESQQKSSQFHRKSKNQKTFNRTRVLAKLPKNAIVKGAAIKVAAPARASAQKEIQELIASKNLDWKPNATLKTIYHQTREDEWRLLISSIFLLACFLAFYHLRQSLPKLRCKAKR